MNNSNKDDYIKFDYNNEIYYCLITDNYQPIRNIKKVEKMNRFANFYNNKMEPIVTGWAIYGNADEMTTITPLMVKRWFEDYIKSKNCF